MQPHPAQYPALATPVLVIGAAYTGKSELAHRTLDPHRKTLVIGTADMSEGLIAARVQELKRQRPDHWVHHDGKLDLASQLRTLAPDYEQVLVDSINQWVANLVLTHAQKYSLEQLAPLCEREVFDLCAAVEETKHRTRIVLVSSEVGAGITPPKPVARLFRQLVSRINCRLAEHAAAVLLVSAGIPLLIKGEWPNLPQ
ncbi:MAG TPA: bifunctional adenosylcobinamide kinase/adenosylcobinamide-phosphate guanylyltransferase [Oligoflexus sp.]|uniref:bifunctional adenosylcobinamide kinase/adenosylcobinamide-phosphate guanylyltransferase n=1 Tax=Oligoflexus sp. TaxID=1971216 RepID=UPI002D63FD3D|nr:bifunctional adenosylcobinamide kinase/adenosylcobinamide-phosphate guanylyltransferase [Oligoflexus sp.]HYX32158.1 bifunctional adenosylcobinamide kinase/adenosylcobinamide-phosphate guanylyltransferase [Oligoflexus sp.]